MKLVLLAVFVIGIGQLQAQDLNWNTSAIPDLSTSFNFGSIGTPASAVNFNVTGPGTITAGPTRFTTAQADVVWRTAITFGAVLDLKTYTLTFNSAVCDLSFVLYDIDGDNSNGDRAIVTANYNGSPQNITMTVLDPGFAGGAPTITGSGTATATGTGTQGNQTDDRVQVSVSGCVTTLTIQYGNNPVGVAGGRSFSIGNLSWSTTTLPIHFLQFSGQKTSAGSIQLKWTAEQQINVDKYEIERSSDGQHFVSAGFITNVNPAGNYSFLDQPTNQRTLFYRIREIDLDGKFQYSSVIALRFPQVSSPGITVFPNPATQSLFITTNDNSIIRTVILIDNNGRIILQKNGPENKVDLGGFAPGLYLVKVIKTTGEVVTSPFVKK